LPENAVNKNVIWSSGNSEIAIVGEDGWVIAVSAGTTTITAQTEAGGLTATCEITVEKEDVGIITPDSYNVIIRVKDDNLTVNSPVSERISIYSVSGTLLYLQEKQPGEDIFNIGQLRDKVLIVRGSSGWVRKILK
jgi:hypothetical protein